VCSIGLASPSQDHDDAERDFNPNYTHLATGDITHRVRRLYKWPVNILSIGHTIASYQNYSGGPYFHHGLDIRADAGSDVRAAAGGKVVNIENYKPGNSAYWEVAILDSDGFLWQYHHIERSSIPQMVIKAYNSGNSISEGTKIGEVYYWSVTTFGERFHHIHLNILGKNKNYHNGFAFLEKLSDTATPIIHEIGLMKNGTKVSGSSVSGNYSIYVQVSDLIRHSKFLVPPYKLEFEIDGQTKVNVWAFNTLPGGASKTDQIHNYFNSKYTCGNYQCRKFIIDLGFQKVGKYSFPIQSGAHRLTLKATDYVGNTTSKEFSWKVVN